MKKNLKTTYNELEYDTALSSTGVVTGRDIGVCIDIEIDINDRLESPEINSCIIYEQLIFYKGVKTIQWGMQWSFH